MVGGPDGVGTSEVLRDVAAEVVHSVAVAFDKPAGEVFLQAPDGLRHLCLALWVLDVLGLLLDGCLQLFLAIARGSAAIILRMSSALWCASRLEYALLLLGMSDTLSYLLD